MQCDLDVADDISLQAHSHRDIQSETDKLVKMQQKWDFVLTKANPKPFETTVKQQKQSDSENKTEEATEFTYLRAKVTKDGNTEAENKKMINKARGAFAALKNIWKTKTIGKKTKIRIFKSSVMNVLIYAAEFWKVTKGTCHMLDLFQNMCHK